MKKIFLIIIIFFLKLFFLYSMPPHPDLIKNYTLNNRNLDFIPEMSISSLQKNIRSFPTTGNRKILVILADFSNTIFKSTVPFYSNLFNGGDDVVLSWKKYFQDMSYGKLILSFDIIGPYKLSKTHDYYGTNGTDGNDLRVQELVNEIVKIARSNNPDLNFSDYDNDKNGYVDGIFVIHQGKGEEISGVKTDIWSHRYSLSGNGKNLAIKFNDVTIDDYAIMPEYNKKPGDSTIGVFCHEFAHILGLPDLYDTNPTSLTDGVGLWGLMAFGAYNGPPDKEGSVPAPLLSWERYILGWKEYKEINIPKKTSFNNSKIIKYSNPILLFIILIGIFTYNIFIFKNINKKILLTINILIIVIILIINCAVNQADLSNFPGMMYNIHDIDNGGEIFKINNFYKYNDEEQYYLIENKVRKKSTWSEYLPGSGLLILFVDNYLIYKLKINDSNITYTGALQANKVNSLTKNGYPFGVGIIEADGNNNLNVFQGDMGSATDTFYKENIDYYKFIYFDYVDKKYKNTNIEINNISSKSNNMSFFIVEN